MKILKAFIVILMLAAFTRTCARAQVLPPPPASQAEVNAGTLTSKYVSPKTLSAYVGEDYSQNLLFWYSAQQALLVNPTATNGQFIPPVDYSGNGWVIATNSISTTRSPVFTSAFGCSGFYLNSSAMVVSNLPLALTNGFTIAVTYQNLGGIPPPQAFIWAMGGYGVSDGTRNIYAEEADNQGTVSAGEGGGETGGSLFYGNLLFGTPAGLYQSADRVHVATLTFDGGANIWITYDGMPTYDSRIERNADWSTLLTGATNFYIGSDVSTEYGGAYFTGIILDIRIYTPYCQPGLQQSLLTYLCQNAGLPINRFIFDGDSIMVSLHTWTSLSAVQQILAPFFHGYLFNTTAQSGRTTAQELTNMYQFAPQKLPGFNGILEQACVNDFDFGINGTWQQQSNQVALTAANYTNMVLCAMTNKYNGIAFQTPTCVYWITNGLFQANYNWLTNIAGIQRGLTSLWSQVYIIDAQADVPSMGTNGAYANTNFTTGVFNADEVHPNSLGYTNLASVYLPVMQRMVNINGYNASSYTNISTIYSTNTIYTLSAAGASYLDTLSGTYVSTNTTVHTVTP